MAGPVVGPGISSPGGGGGGGISSWGQASTAKFTGTGSPVGVVTPTGSGDLYVQEVLTTITKAAVTADSAPTLPLTVVAAVNDTFVFTPIGTGTPETFTIAPGIYTTLAGLEAAVGAAVGGSAEAFSTLVTTTNNGTELLFTMVGNNGAGDNGNTLTEGDGGAAAIGITSPPDTFAGGSSVTTGPALWQATGVANTDWVLQGGTSVQSAKFAFDHTTHAALAAGVDTGIVIPDGATVSLATIIPLTAWDGTTPHGGLSITAAGAVLAANSTDFGLLFNTDMTNVLTSGDMTGFVSGDLIVSGGDNANQLPFHNASGSPAPVYVAVTDGASGDPASTTGTGLIVVQWCT